MSYKSIDFQTSLPRTAELSPLAQQQQHKPTAEQALLAQHNVKTTERQAHMAGKAESASQGKITDQQQRGGGHQSSSRRKKQTGETERETEHASEHPFKGKHIDFMG
ncbi:hypothetical protein [Cohnella caldifontis]|uniref:hypothetical protein n=1 Tax=Cohnella caldifontis TaxID=3027471 RepID=UPI0023EAC0C9|nr:hypothetical protein [Cohnella sp. YIM B05605]